MNEFNQFSLKDKLKNIWIKYKKYIIILAIVLVVILILVKILGKKTIIDDDNINLAYKSVEQIMVNKAMEYNKNNKVDNNTYLSLTSLNLKIDDKLKCNNISGVLKKSSEYYTYLSCDKYNSAEIESILESNEKNKAYGTLKGDNPYILTTEEYIEAGYEIDSKYTVNVKGNNIKDGVNIVNYYILENNKYVAELKRIVIAEDVVASDAPKIELIGNSTRTLPQYVKYNETGYKATDAIDGDITSKVKVTGDVNEAIPGTYQIMYTITNSKGLSTDVKRTIIVNKMGTNLDISSELSTKEMTSSTVTITLMISGDGYQKTVLPNNEEDMSYEITYEASKNGVYDFIIYDKNNNIEVEEIKIDNIDNTKPTGLCSAKIKDGKTIVNASATDFDSGIKEYGYNYAGSKNMVSISPYTINSEQKTITLEVVDKVGNQNTIACSVEIEKEDLSGAVGGTPVNPAPNNSDLITNYLPGNNVNSINRVIASAVKSRGYYTRSAVTTAAATLINTLSKYNYKVPYELGGRYSSGDDWGVNPKWGAPSSRNPKYPRTGLDCRNFVIWSFKQAGLSLVRGFGYEGSKTKNVNGNVYSSISDGRPGDVLDVSGHIMLIYQKKANSYIVAESNGACCVRFYEYTFKALKNAGYHAYNMDAVYNGTGYYCNTIKASYRPYSGGCKIPTSLFPSYYK